MVLRLALLIFAAAVSKPSPLEIALTPAVCNQPCTVRITASVTPNEDNRFLWIQIDGTNFRGSQIQLEGEKAPRTHRVEYRDLPVGEYDVTVVLYNTTKEVTRRHLTLMVMP